MTDLHAWGIVAVIALVTAGLRFLPFALFRGERKTPAVLEKLSRTDMLQLLTILQRHFVRAMDPGSAATVLSRCTAKQLYDGAQAIAHAITLLQANGSSGHAVGCLMASMRP